MKFIFLVTSILKNWFTIYRKYTLTVIMTMMLSVLALFFIAEKAASENLESLYLINYIESTYEISASNERFEKDNEPYPDGEVKVDYSFLDEYIESGLPMPIMDNERSEYPYETSMIVTELNDDREKAFPFLYFNGSPVFSKKEQEKYGELVTCFDNYEYKIIDGRDLTNEDLEEKKPYVVVEVDSYFNSYGSTPQIKVGDILTCGDYKLTVIGLCEYTGSDDPQYTYSRIPFYLSDECMKHYKGFGHGNIEMSMTNGSFTEAQTDEGLSEDGSTTVVVGTQDYDIMTTTGRLVFEHPLTNSDYEKLLEITGLSEEEVSNSLYKVHETSGMDVFIKTTLLSGAVFAVFCALNIVSVIWFLLKQNMLTFRIFRVYGARDRLIFRIILFLVGVLVVISGLLAFALSPLTMIVYNKLLTGYEYRFLCFFSAFGIMLVINILAAVPTALLVIKRSPVGK